MHLFVFIHQLSILQYYYLANQYIHTYIHTYTHTYIHTYIHILTQQVAIIAIISITIAIDKIPTITTRIVSFCVSSSAFVVGVAIVWGNPVWVNPVDLRSA